MILINNKFGLDRGSYYQLKHITTYLSLLSSLVSFFLSICQRTLCRSLQAKTSGEYRSRTDDPLRARQVL